MRHTLLPTAEKLAIRREYYTRVTIVACFVVSAALLVGAAALLPAYLKARDAEAGSLGQIASLQNAENESGRAAMAAELKADGRLLRKLSENAKSARVSKVLEEIVAARGNLKLSTLDHSRLSTSTAAVNIQGTAPTRNALLQFKSRLESLYSGAKAELPISELAASSNVRFSMRFSYPLP